ncbi:MAG TPA: trypsin-like peptidase domain-containing protein [Kiritimatiellia bacterium]|nr:trypsin-like peptidase domain-containing protein [Kiritimatiellia bacterium]
MHKIQLICLVSAVVSSALSSAASPNAARLFGNAIADVVEKVMPSVVVVRTESRQYRVARDWFFGHTHRIPETLVGQGSGVIISREGYLLTNNHVIEGAQSVEVVLNDGTKLPAKIIGRDHHTDLAVLKIEASDREFPPVEIGDSDALRVGEFVIALGSPFSLASSVTLGIVSQKGRSIGLLPFEDFIQTDAAVNRGNSGGPLLDVDGRLVGINTVIQTSGLSKGNIGISFAVPVNLAVNVSESIIRSGRWERPWIGIYMQETDKGVRVRDVVANSPASRGGLMQGDIITQVDRRNVQKINEIQKAIFTRKIGDPATIEVVRGNDKLDLELITETMPIPELIMRE